MRAGWRAAGCYVFANAASLSVGYPDTSYDEYGKRPHTPALSTTTSQLRKGGKKPEVGHFITRGAGAGRVVFGSIPVSVGFSTLSPGSHRGKSGLVFFSLSDVSHPPPY